MSQSLLHLVLRHAEGLVAGPAAEPDAELLSRFVRTRDEPAFAELLRRHGPMVWAVCRHSLAADADAEDAFQATFLALIRSAKGVRRGSALAAWLHGVAVRVATKVKRSAVRRRQREERVAEREADCPVPEATWDKLLVAVHEEVNRLPDSLRTAFVMCELEGVRQTEAAARLGWKAGTLTGRLTRARQLLLERLTNRGLAPALAGGSLGLGVATAVAAVPLGLMHRAMSLTHAGGAVSPAILELVRGVTPMLAIRMKLAAAALVLAGGLGTVLIPMVIAQPTPGGVGPGSAGGPPGSGGPGPGGGPAFGVPGGQPGLFSGPGAGGGPAGRPMAAPTNHAQWEYKFVSAGGTSIEFVQLFKDMGNDGWEFCGKQEFANEKELADLQKAFPDMVIVKRSSSVALIFKRTKSGAPRGFGNANPFGGMPGLPVALNGAPGGGNILGGGGVSGIPPPEPASGGPGGGGGYRAIPPPAPSPEKPLTVIALKHASAPDLGVVLEKVFSRAALAITADSRTNSLIIRADDATMKDVKALIEKLDTPSTATRP